MPVGVADRDVVPARVVLLEDREDALRREAVDRRHHGRLDEAAVGERQEVEAVVEDVELRRALERGGDVERLPHLRVERRILGVPRRRAPDEARARDRVGRREQRHVDASLDQTLRQEGCEQLPRPVTPRGHSPRDRGEHPHAEAVGHRANLDDRFQTAVGGRLLDLALTDTARRANCEQDRRGRGSSGVGDDGRGRSAHRPLRRALASHSRRSRGACARARRSVRGLRTPDRRRGGRWPDDVESFHGSRDARGWPTRLRDDVVDRRGADVAVRRERKPPITTYSTLPSLSVKSEGIESGVALGQEPLLTASAPPRERLRSGTDAARRPGRGQRAELEVMRSRLDRRREPEAAGADELLELRERRLLDLLDPRDPRLRDRQLTLRKPGKRTRALQQRRGSHAHDDPGSGVSGCCTDPRSTPSAHSRPGARPRGQAPRTSTRRLQRVQRRSAVRRVFALRVSA